MVGCAVTLDRSFAQFRNREYRMVNEVSDETANMALDLFWYLRKIYPLFLLKYLCNHFRIGIKDKFPCFMMVLNYHQALEYVFYSYSI